MKNSTAKKIVLLTIILAGVGCGRIGDGNSDPSGVSGTGSGGSYTNPTVLVDFYEREVWKDCSGGTVSDSMVRRPALSTIKINPIRNFAINSSSFFNLDTGAEFTPHLGIIGGDGGDNYKFITFCQSPRASHCDMVVNNGDNRIEYKYWSYQYAPCSYDSTQLCKRDVLEENQTRVIHFTVQSNYSPKVCKRQPTKCPMEPTPTWSECQYE